VGYGWWGSEDPTDRYYHPNSLEIISGKEEYSKTDKILPEYKVLFSGLHCRQDTGAVWMPIAELDPFSRLRE
jgi:hypothetical protein